MKNAMKLFVLVLMFLSVLLLASCNLGSLEGEWYCEEGVILDVDTLSLHADTSITPWLRDDIIARAVHKLPSRLIFTFGKDSIRMTSCNSSLYFGCRFIQYLYQASKDSIILVQTSDAPRAALAYTSDRSDRMTLSSNEYYDNVHARLEMRRIPPKGEKVEKEKLIDFIISKTFKSSGEEKTYRFTRWDLLDYGEVIVDDNLESDSLAWRVWSSKASTYLFLGDEIIKVVSLEEGQLSGFILNKDQDVFQLRLLSE